MKMYLKLGEKALNFFDPQTKVSIKGKQIVEVDKELASSARIKKAINQGHLSTTNEEEYDSWMETSKSFGSVPMAQVTGNSSKEIKELKTEIEKLKEERDNSVPKETMNAILDLALLEEEEFDEKVEEFGFEKADAKKLEKIKDRKEKVILFHKLSVKYA